MNEDAKEHSRLLKCFVLADIERFVRDSCAYRANVSSLKQSWVIYGKPSFEISWPEIVRAVARGQAITVFPI